MTISIKSIALFCVEIDPEVMAHIATLWEKNLLRVLVVKANTQKQEVLHDIALLTGAEYIASDTGLSLQNAEPTMLGDAKKILSDHAQTHIIDGAGSAKKKIEELKKELASITDPNEYDLVEKRIARLKNEVGMIRVGAATEEAMQYLYYKLLNGVNSTKASIEEGIVEGGGMALYKIAQTLGDSVGEKILKRALIMPLRKIIENGGKDFIEVLLNMPKDKGYDAKNDIYVDMLKDGIIDPMKVTRCAVENAVSLASTFITVHGSVSLIRKLED